MAERPYSRNKNHLKNLRKQKKSARRSEKKQSRAAVASSSNNPLVTLGLFITASIVILFAASFFLQFQQGSSAGPSQPAPEPAESTPAAALSIDPAAIEVRILNGCGVPGACRVMTGHMRDLGFDVVAMDNADNFEYTHTLVVNHTGRPEVGATVAEGLGVGNITMQEDKLALVDVTLILGADWERYAESTSSEEQNRDQPRGFVAEKIDAARKLLGLD